MAFDPNEKLMNMRGKDYLEVKWRIVWFREDHPMGSIRTEIVNSDPVVFKASVYESGGILLATGHGTPKMQGVAAKRPFEGAETAAIGRALAAAGYGTQFTGEDEGEYLADAPVERSQKQAPSRPYSPETLKRAFAAKVAKLSGANASDKMRGAFVGKYNAALGSDEARHKVCVYLFGAEKSAELSAAQIIVALNHINSDETMASRELNIILMEIGEKK